MGKILQAMGLQLAAEPTDGTWSPVGNYEADVQPPSRALGREAVTIDRTLGLPAAYRAVELSAGLASTLTLDSFRGKSLLTGQQRTLVDQPDPWRPLDSWIERQVVNYCTEGNNFLRVYKHSDKLTTAALEVLNPHTTQVLWSRVAPGARARKSYGIVTRDGQVELPDAEVIHSFGLELPGLDRGVSPIGWCRAALGGVLAVRDYADRWFQDEAVEAVLTTEQRLEKGMPAEYRKAWYERDETQPPGPRVRVLGSGLKYEPMMLKPEDAQWLEAQNAGVLDVARMFGVPAAYLEAAVSGTALTYTTLETLNTQFIRTTLNTRYLRKIAGAVTLALPRGQRARFNTGELLRPDVKTQADVDAINITNGVYDGAYVRQRDGIDAPAPAPRPAPAPAPTNGA